MVTAGKVQQMHQLVKHDAIPKDLGHRSKECKICYLDILPEDIDLLYDLDMEDTQKLLESSNILKQKIVYLGGFLANKFIEPVDDDDKVSSEFIAALNRGGLHVPT